MASDSAKHGPKRGVIAVLTRADDILMIQRADHLVAGGAWCFPGGAIEPGETPAHALARELREELSLTIEPLRPVWRWRSDDGSLDLEWWTADILGGRLTPNPQEVQRAEWMTVQTIRATPSILPNNLEFLDFAERSGLLARTSPGGQATSEA